MRSHPLAPRVNEVLLQYIAKAQEIYGRTFALPRVAYNLRGRVAGTANFDTYTIRLNVDLLTSQTESFLAWTVPHELAHLITDILYPEARHRHHGPEWQKVMRDLGQRAVRCHTFLTKPARVVKRSYRYVCTCRKFDLTSILHNKIQKGRNRRCKSCRSTLVFLNEIA